MIDGKENGKYTAAMVALVPNPETPAPMLPSILKVKEDEEDTVAGIETLFTDILTEFVGLEKHRGGHLTS